jgi:3-dehydroquinate synthase
MPSVTVGLGDRSYDVLIEPGLIDRAGDILGTKARGGRVVIVTEENVAAHVLPRFAAALATAGLVADPIILPPGESTKDWAHLAGLCDALLAREIERTDHILPPR